LLFVAEPFLKLLSKLKEEQQDDSVAAEERSIAEHGGAG
jgi:hypothetical protein